MGRFSCNSFPARTNCLGIGAPHKGAIFNDVMFPVQWEELWLLSTTKTLHCTIYDAPYDIPGSSTTTWPKFPTGFVAFLASHQQTACSQRQMNPNTARDWDHGSLCCYPDWNLKPSFNNSLCFSSEKYNHVIWQCAI